MKRRTEKVSNWELIALALVSIGLFVLMNGSKRTAKAPDYDARFGAARLSQQAFDAIRDNQVKAGATFDRINDPNKTGLIGSQYSLITVGRGDPAGVMTATNPNFAAVVVSLLRKAGLRKGNVVAIGLSGSIPPLNIEVLAACNVLGLKPILISAVSSGMWGANNPEFTWLDMEALLMRQGILPYRSVAASVGGEDDNGRGLSPAGRAWVDSAIVRNNVPQVGAAALDQSVGERMKAYDREARGEPIRAFINIGNGVANLGEEAKPLPNGVVDRRPAQLPNPSVMRSMAERGAVLLNFTDPARLAYRYRFPVAPVPLPTLARGRMFLEKRYPIGLAGVFAVIIIVLLFVIIRFDLDHYVRRALGLKPRPVMGMEIGE